MTRLSPFLFNHYSWWFQRRSNYHCLSPGGYCSHCFASRRHCFLCSCIYTRHSIFQWRLFELTQMRLPESTRMCLDKDICFMLPSCCCGTPYPSMYSQTLSTSNNKQHVPQCYETCSANAELQWHQKGLYKHSKKLIYISNAFRRHLFNAGSIFFLVSFSFSSQWEPCEGLEQATDSNIHPTGGGSPQLWSGKLFWLF